MLTVVKSLPSVFSMVVLTFVLIFVYGMLGWSLYGAELPESWGTIGRAMLTLFILLTLENFPVYLAEAEQVNPYSPFFFVSYVLLAAFIVFNLLIGIVIGSMEKAREQEARNAPEDPGPVPEPDGALLDRIAQLQDSLSELEDDLRGRSARASVGA